MFLYNCFGTNEQSVVRFNEYPPFTALFQYLFLGISKVYREDIIITAQNILYFSIILPIIKNVKWKKGGIKYHYLQILQKEQGSKNRYLVL